MSVPLVDGYVMVLQPEEPKISLSGINHFARAASEFESAEGVSLFPELRIISTITREVEQDTDGDEDPTGNRWATSDLFQQQTGTRNSEWFLQCPLLSGEFSCFHPHLLLAHLSGILEVIISLLLSVSQ